MPDPIGPARPRLPASRATREARRIEVWRRRPAAGECTLYAGPERRARPIKTPRLLEVTEDHISFDHTVIVDRDSVDVLINGHRVWSVDLISTPPPEDGLLQWPPALAPYMNGTADILLVDSVTGETIAGRSVQFGTKTAPISIVDTLGRQLSINKWGRLGKSFEGADDGLRQRILDRLDWLVGFCQERELRPFIVGGTLLGAVRDGKILGHDDDADLAYLSQHSHPSDLAVESFRIERELRDLDVEVVRHSAAHLQLTFRTALGKVDGYVDLFTAFFREDGTINQPFHVRGPMHPYSMLPFSIVELEGREYPAPADPDRWLTLNYDENWRTPLPGYRLRTPRGTQRRFRNWFGSFNFQRDFWEARYEETGAGVRVREDDTRAAQHLAKLVPPESRVLDLGCGDGVNTEWLIEHGFEVTAVDYSPNALNLARERVKPTSSTEASLRLINLNEFRGCAQLLRLIAAEPQPIHILVSHVLERMGHLGRHNVLRLLRQAVRLGGTVTAMVDCRPAEDVTFNNPSTWHLEVTEFKDELASFGLGIVGQRLLRETPRDLDRRTLIFELALLPESRKGSMT